MSKKILKVYHSNYKGTPMCVASEDRLTDEDIRSVPKTLSQVEQIANEYLTKVHGFTDKSSARTTKIMIIYKEGLLRKLGRLQDKVDSINVTISH